MKIFTSPRECAPIFKPWREHTLCGIISPTVEPTHACHIHLRNLRWMTEQWQIAPAPTSHWADNIKRLHNAQNAAEACTTYGHGNSREPRLPTMSMTIVDEISPTTPEVKLDSTIEMAELTTTFPKSRVQSSRFPCFRTADRDIHDPLRSDDTTTHPDIPLLL